MCHGIGEFFFLDLSWYIALQGIGFGSPSQRLSQYDKYKVRRASEVVTEFRMSKNILQTETSALAVNKKQAKKNKIRYYQLGVNFITHWWI